MSGVNATLGANGWEVPELSGGVAQLEEDGSLEANVQPRSGLLADLLALDGAPGEISYPTDHPDARVLHNGVAGEAEAVWANGGAELSVTLSGASPSWSLSSIAYRVISVTFTGTFSGSPSVDLASAVKPGMLYLQNNGPVDILISGLNDADTTLSAGGARLVYTSSSFDAIAFGSFS